MALSSQDYHNKIKTVLNGPIYRKLKVDLTTRIDRQTAFLIKESDIPKQVAKKLIPHTLVPPRLYQLPVIHKKDLPLRPTVNCTASPTYLLAKHLKGILSLYAGQTAHHIKNSQGIQPDTQDHQTTRNIHPGELQHALIIHQHPTRGHTADAVTTLPQPDYKSVQTGPNHNLCSV